MTRSARFTVLLCYAAMMVLAIATNLMPVLLTTLKSDLGALRDEQLGRIAGVTFLGLVIAILLTGPLADRWGAKIFTLLGNGLMAAALGMLGFVDSYPLVLIAVFIMGFGAGVLDMVLSPIVGALRSGAASMNLLHSFYCLGAVATVLSSAWALQSGLHWQTICLLLIALPTIVLAGFMFAYVPPMVAENQTRTRLRTLGRQRYFQGALLAILLGGATEAGMAQWLPAYAERTLAYSKWSADMAFVAFNVAMVAGRVGAGLLASRMPSLTLMSWCCAGSVVLFLLASFLHSPALALAACIAVGVTGAPLWPSMLSVAADRFPHGGASMFGLLAAFGNAGGIFMPWIVGLVADLGSMRLGLATSAISPLLMLLVLSWLRGQRDPAHSRAEADVRLPAAAAPPSAG